ncbi:MAG: hypothetical protein GQ573_02405, partial [Gammaproteobacteria bacterium]|nr:hypothetical protein [Gammaproteobacteria bacterium]
MSARLLVRSLPELLPHLLLQSLLAKFNFLCFFLFFLPMTSQAVPAMGMGYEPKYAADYKHFDYVNPDAVKQGELTLMGVGTFDSLNPY